MGPGPRLAGILLVAGAVLAYLVASVLMGAR